MSLEAYINELYKSPIFPTELGLDRVKELVLALSEEDIVADGFKWSAVGDGKIVLCGECWSKEGWDGTFKATWLLEEMDNDSFGSFYLDDVEVIA